MKGKAKGVSYSKWGYLFIAPFFISFFIFSLIPLYDTVRYSFYEYYRSGLKEIGPNFVGLANYYAVFASDLGKYTWNTFIMWIMGFIPQIVISMALAAWFTDPRLNIRGKQFFSVILYLPNLIMASAFSMLFFTLFSEEGPINSILLQLGLVDGPVKFFISTGLTRTLVATMNFLMWFGNSTIMLVATVRGIDPDILDAAKIDGCNHSQTFFQVTLPIIRPVLSYIIITSLIGGLQMFDVPQILTAGRGTPNRTTMTLIMYLNQHLKANNYGMAGSISVFLAVISGVLCFFVYRLMVEDDPDGTMLERKKHRKEAAK